jgi:hypothetical protein
VITMADFKSQLADAISAIGEARAATPARQAGTV